MTFASYIRREALYACVNFWRATFDCRCYGQHSQENESGTEIRREPFIRAVLVLDKTCSYKWYSSRLIFPLINGPNVYKVERYNVIIDVLGGYSKHLERSVRKLLGARASGVLETRRTSNTLNIARRFKINT